MSDAVSVQRSYGTLTKEEQFDGYSKVVVVVDEDSGIEYSAGTDTGRTLTLNCPFGTQKMANDILSKIRGYQYQPYSATGAHIDPAAELGDGITVGGVYGGLFSKNVTHGSLYTADVSAPGGEKISYKYEYKTQTDRKIQRHYKEMQATFTVQASRIDAEVTARDALGTELRASLKIQDDRITQEVSDRDALGTELRASLNIQADQISAKVSKTGGNDSSFEWAHDDNKIIYKSNGSEVFRIDASGAKVTGEIRATSGKIGGFDIQSNYLSYNSQTWGGTNTTGAYLGTSGLQLGRNFKVDMKGNLTASSGTFTGAVYAGSIKHGEVGGYFSGSGLSEGSVSGAQIAGSTLGTSKFTEGVNTSLGNANYSYDAVANGAEVVNIGAYMFYFGGSAVRKTTTTIDGKKIHYLSWSDRG